MALNGWGPYRVCVLVSIAGAACGVSAPVPPSVPPVIEVSALDGSNGYIVIGSTTQDRSGESLCGIGDFNGDGIDDMAISAKYADSGGIIDNGKVFVVFGGAGVGAAGVVDSGSLDGSNGFAIIGADEKDSIGARSIASAGDVNHDGFVDLIIGARWAHPNAVDRAGKAYVVFGGPGVGASGTLDLSTIDGANGFVVFGTVALDCVGSCVDGAGDVNGDGIDDVVIGSVGRTAGVDFKPGAACVVFGRDTASDGPFPASMSIEGFDGTNGFVITGLTHRGAFGDSVSGGDVNGDGYGDLAIGAPLVPAAGTTDGGSAYVVFGGPGVGATGSFDLTTLDGANGFVVPGIAPSGELGRAISASGDVNGDGVRDVLVSAPDATANGKVYAGESYVVFGRTAQDGGFPASVDLASLDGLNGFSIRGVAPENRSGREVAAGGDVNGDGIDDLSVNAVYANPGGITTAGEAYIVFGRRAPSTGPFPAVLDLASLGEGWGTTIRGAAYGDRMGESVAFAGDVNDDGAGDFLLGSQSVDPGGLITAGEACVVFGLRTRFQRATPADVDGDGAVNAQDFSILAAHFGAAVPPGTLGDCTGDGVVDARDFRVFAADFGLRTE